MVMNKKALIILYPLKIKKFDLERWEINFLKKKLYLEIHSFHNLLNRDLINAHKSQISKDKIIYNFDSVNLWKKRVKFLKNKYPKIFFLNLLMKDKFYKIIIFLILKKFSLSRIDVAIRGLPLLVDNISYFKFFLNKIINITSKRKIKWFVVSCKIKIIDFLINFLNLEANFLLAAGKQNLLPKKKNLTSKLIIEDFSSQDRSRFLRNQNCKKIIKGNYCVYLGELGPYDPGDHLYINEKNHLDHRYYDRLNYFFDDFEKINNTKIVVAVHPKALANRDSRYLGNRLAFYNKSNELIKNCKFVICSLTVSISYAVLHKKPILFIYDNTFNNTSRLQLNFLNSLIGGKIINTENYKKNEIFIKTDNINLNKYNKFIKHYISQRNDNKTNYQIILDLVKQYGK